MKSGKYTNCNCSEGGCPPPHRLSASRQSYLDKYFEGREVVQGKKERGDKKR